MAQIFFDDLYKKHPSPRAGHLVDEMLKGFKSVTESNEVKEFDVTVKYYRNMPSITTEKTISVDACNEIEAEEKVRRMYPNITTLTVTECPPRKD